MSMLSAQVDRLRELATRCDELQVGAVRAVRVPLDMGSILREAADTIWELRCKMADMVDMRERARVAESENAELREELAKARDPQRIGGQADPSSFVYAIEQLREFRWQHATNDEDAIPYINNVADAHERENAKLREDLEFERSENGWAREFLNRIGRKCGTKDCPSLVAYVTKLEAENAKLRELVRDYERCTMHADCSRCEYDGKLSTHCPFSPCFLDADELCELGIEVE